MIRTRVGYAGGEKTNPTYYSLGNHSETIQIDYDPEIVSYEELLEVFWNNHSPTYPAPSDQYKSIIFYMNEEQKEAAELSMQKKQENSNQQILTEIRELNAFYLAEDYHQKYYLRQYQTIFREYARIYPDWQDFTNSTAVTKANGFVGGSSNPDTLEKLASDMGLSDVALAKMADIVKAHY